MRNGKVEERKLTGVEINVFLLQYLILHHCTIPEKPSIRVLWSFMPLKERISFISLLNVFERRQTNSCSGPRIASGIYDCRTQCQSSHRGINTALGDKRVHSFLKDAPTKPSRMTFLKLQKNSSNNLRQIGIANLSQDIPPDPKLLALLMTTDPCTVNYSCLNCTTGKLHSYQNQRASVYYPQSEVEHAYPPLAVTLGCLSEILKNRKFRIKVDRCNRELKDVTYVIPQGSHLGPLMFLVYINQMFEIVKECKIWAHSDPVYSPNVRAQETKFSTEIPPIRF
ncbi:hypothetical protein J6590_041569 [Homalodisca vitripennis]|nr:hypothetical protein J6590_041569 [Homalodisca vitripennis]